MKIFVRSDLKLSRGKYAAQAAHAALLLVGAHPGGRVVVLGGKREDVEGASAVVTDAGRTEVDPEKVTAGATFDEGEGPEGERGTPGPFYPPAGDADTSLKQYVASDLANAAGTTVDVRPHDAPRDTFAIQGEFAARALRDWVCNKAPEAVGPLREAGLLIWRPEDGFGD